MKITEPKRIFDAELKLTENVIANTGSKKWIISDLWVSNKSDVSRTFTLIAAYQGTYKEEKRTLFNKVPIEAHQTMVVGNIIIEPNEMLYAYADGEIHAHYRTDFEGDNNDLVFIAKESGVSGNDITLEILNPQVQNSQLTCTVDSTAKTISISLETDDSTIPAKASLTTDFFDPNNDVVFTSKAFGEDGNLISIEIVNDGTADQALTVTDNADMEDWKIKVILATDTNENAITTASELVTAVNNNSSLVDCTLADGNDGTGFVRTMVQANLSGGIDANVTTTANDIINLLKTNGELDKLVYIERADGNSGEGVVEHIKVDGSHIYTKNFIGGDYDKYNPNHIGITGITITGYGRVI